MQPTALDAASHLAGISAAVASAVADPSALAQLPHALSALHRAFALRFTVATDPHGSIVAKSVPQRIVYGWANVVTQDGATVTDLQGDEMDVTTLQKAVHEFMAVRAVDTMHDEDGQHEIVDSLFVTKDLSDAMGWYPGREGWFVGVQVTPDVWARVESGELRAFSIAGDALSTPLEDADADFAVV